jgi:hypothetical protein
MNNPMTADVWEASANPMAMLSSLPDSGQAGYRRLRLFMAACCRQQLFFSSLYGSDADAVAVAERYADDQADLDQLHQARRAALALGPAWCCLLDARGGAGQWIDCVDRSRPSVPHRRSLLAGLLREVFGNPWWPPAVEPGWLTWHGGVVVHLAHATYEERHHPSGHLDPNRLAVLADALEDAGCTGGRLLAHLRAGGEHVRGCFAVDALRGLD